MSTRRPGHHAAPGLREPAQRAPPPRASAHARSRRPAPRSPPATTRPARCAARSTCRSTAATRAAPRSPSSSRVVPHRDAGPAAGTILASEGGPGFSSTAAADGYAWLFDPLLDTRDLLLIDLRGTGRSAAIDCPDLQHGVGDAGRRDARLRGAARRLGLAVRQRRPRGGHRGRARRARHPEARLLRALGRRPAGPGLRRAPRRPPAHRRARRAVPHRPRRRLPVPGGDRARPLGRARVRALAELPPRRPPPGRHAAAPARPGARPTR